MIRDYKGAAPRTSLAAGISSSATSFSVAASGGNGYPTGSGGDFPVAIDAGLTSEEKILCSARAGDVFTVATGGRGWDDTTASAHNNAATVDHVGGATDLREANAHINASSGVHGRTGALVGTTDTQTLTNKTLTTPTIASMTNAQHDHSNAAGGGLVTTGVSLAGGSTVTISAAGVKGLVVKGAASQTANLIEYQDSTGTMMFAIGNTGGLVTRAAANDGTSQVRTDAHGALFGRLLCIVGGASKWIELYE